MLYFRSCIRLEFGMSTFLEKIRDLFRSGVKGGPLELERLAKAKEVLEAELRSRRIDGKPVTHRRLETLMLSAGTQKRETVRLLRELGARPSSRHGSRLWTRD